MKTTTILNQNRLPLCVWCTASLSLLILSSLLAPSQASPRDVAFQSFFKLPNFSNNAITTSSTSSSSRIQLEDELLSTIRNTDKRLDNSDEISQLVLQLEEAQPKFGIDQPAIAPQVKGRWRLLHTNNADTASPIQRKAVDASKYNIYQDIFVKNIDNVDRLIVSQVVKFGDSVQLAVDALASTAEYPLEELTKREGTGKVLGLNILGVSLVGEEAEENPDRPNSRIDFVFDEGNFELGNGLTIPYPVPFRLPILRDTVKGWIDITYLSDRIRISRGNKGTTFVLVKEEDDDDDDDDEE